MLELYQIFYKDDLRSIYGTNLSKIASLCGIHTSDLNAIIVKQRMKYFPIPKNEAWRVQIIKELLSIKSRKCELNGFTSKEIDQMLMDLCIL